MPLEPSSYKGPDHFKADFKIAFKILEGFYYCYTIPPWTKNISRSLLKQPKIYIWDWSQVIDPGTRYENFTASHLLKATHLWTDLGLGQFSLHFLRDKEKREVNFIVTKNEEPWFLVEVKTSKTATLNGNLEFFQKQIQAPHAFQIAIDMDYIDIDCFQYRQPITVPAKTFLSQLV